MGFFDCFNYPVIVFGVISLSANIATFPHVTASPPVLVYSPVTFLLHIRSPDITWLPSALLIYNKITPWSVAVSPSASSNKQNKTSHQVFRLSNTLIIILKHSAFWHCSLLFLYCAKQAFAQYRSFVSMLPKHYGRELTHCSLIT